MGGGALPQGVVVEHIRSASAAVNFLGAWCVLNEAPWRSRGFVQP